MKHKLYNKLGQPVGEYDDVTKVYWTDRDAKKGELFLKKHWFGGVYFKTGTAIDVDILNKLVEHDCRYIHIRVFNLGKRPFIVTFTPEHINKMGKSIDYDRVVQGKNITHFGTQIAFDIYKGIIGGPKQKTLKS